jgi:hypothetical protein
MEPLPTRWQRLADLPLVPCFELFAVLERPSAIEFRLKGKLAGAAGFFPN